MKFHRRYSLNTDNTLVIKKLILDDAAMFQCLAINEAGENSASTWLRVKSTWRRRCREGQGLRVRVLVLVRVKGHRVGVDVTNN